MQYDRLTTGLAVVLGALTVVLTVLGLVTSPAVLFLAATFGMATYFVYYHASGKMANRLYQRVEQQARVDGGRNRRAGPREEWTPPRDGQTAREAGAGGTRRGRRQQQRRTRQRRRQHASRASSASNSMSAAEAYQRLDLDPDADDDRVKAAYRKKVKDVHPDTDGGDEESFKQVKEAYERLSE